MLDEDNKTILCNRIINILAKKGFDKIEEPRNLRLREQLDIKESFNIVLEFLKKFDINLYNMFLNLVEHDKESFLFLNEDINEDIKEFAYGCVKEDGKLIIYSSEAEFTGEPIEKTYFGCGGVANIPDLQNKLIRLARGGFKHHTTVGVGHMKDILTEAFSTYLHYDVVDIDK